MVGVHHRVILGQLLHAVDLPLRQVVDAGHASLLCWSAGSLGSVVTMIVGMRSPLVDLVVVFDPFNEHSRARMRAW